MSNLNDSRGQPTPVTEADATSRYVIQLRTSPVPIDPRRAPARSLRLKLVALKDVGASGRHAVIELITSADRALAPASDSRCGYCAGRAVEIGLEI